MSHSYSQFEEYGRTPEFFDRALDHLFLRRMATSEFTKTIPRSDGSCLLQKACLHFPQLAIWMLVKGAAPTPEQCSACLIELAAGDGGVPWRVQLVRALWARGCDINAEVGRRGTPLAAIHAFGVYYLDSPRRSQARAPLLQALLEMPELRLELRHKPAEIVARRSGLGWFADQVSASREQRERWSVLRKGWVGSVVRAARRSAP